ncbi:MAG: hypothetical protein WBB72_15300, partial [Methyloceanibacter sp.]
MLTARKFAAAAVAIALIAGGCFGVPSAALAAKHQAKAHTKVQPEAPIATCQDEPGLAMLASPMAPWKGAPLRVIFAAEKPLDGELSLIAPNGNIAAASGDRHGGPPYVWFAEVASPAAGTWQAMLVRGGAAPECRTVTRNIVVQRREPPRPVKGRGVWPVRDAWDRDTENLYSAWIEKLFDAPIDEELSWSAMHDVLRDKSRNVLFNSLGLREDEKGQIIQPDCADVPYFLRAYFAFKMGLPFGYSKCTRGDGGQAPKCPQWWNIENEEPTSAPPGGLAPPGEQVGFFGVFAAPGPVPVLKLPPKPQGLVPGFGYYLRTTIANGVQSGNGRTAADDNDTDYYPVALSEDTLRPGTIYA